MQKYFKKINKLGNNSNNNFKMMKNQLIHQIIDKFINIYQVLNKIIPIKNYKKIKLIFIKQIKKWLKIYNKERTQYLDIHLSAIVQMEAANVPKNKIGRYCLRQQWNIDPIQILMKLENFLKSMIIIYKSMKGS